MFFKHDLPYLVCTRSLQANMRCTKVMGCATYLHWSFIQSKLNLQHMHMMYVLEVFHLVCLLNIKCISPYMNAINVIPYQHYPGRHHAFKFCFQRKKNVCM